MNWRNSGSVENASGVAIGPKTEGHLHDPVPTCGPASLPPRAAPRPVCYLGLCSSPCPSPVPQLCHCHPRQLEAFSMCMPPGHPPRAAQHQPRSLFQVWQTCPKSHLPPLDGELEDGLWGWCQVHGWSPIRVGWELSCEILGKFFCNATLL